MHDALSDLRRTRRARRLGDVEWFDLAYRVYIAAIFGGSAVIVLSDQVGDAEATPSQITSVFGDGPAVLGLIAVLAAALGLRSGSDGGPLSIEAADVRHLLLAPIERRSVLTRPFVQRLRSAAFTASIVGGIGGVLAAQRLPGSPAAWIASGAAAGALVGLVFVAVASITHALRVSRPLATAVAAALVVWQSLAIFGDVTGPGDRFGQLALWGYDQRPGDLVAVGATLALIVIAWCLVGRLRVEPLARRGDLVSQLRFAVTMQDLRTVVLLRRQLRNERPRRTPWLGLRPAGGSARGAIWRRSWRGVARTPAGRLGRMAGLAGASGLAAVAVVRGTTPAFVAMGVLLFLLGLEAVEPLSQEIDQPGLTDGLPIARGSLHVHLLVASAGLLVPFAALGAAVVALIEPDAAAAAFALALPVVLLGMAGAVVSTVRDAPNPVAAESPFVPPEMAGFGNAMRVLVPVAVSTLAALPAWAAREEPGSATVVRSIVGIALVVTAIGWWVTRRDRWRTAWQRFVAGAKP
ncbi:MAG TPA: hypothetical protein VNO51_06340 [Ilumatobacteraceae bacterium]|nr:hypothetical protein [Ilumatobacteraceae bacterium]